MVGILANAADAVANWPQAFTISVVVICMTAMAIFYFRAMPK